MATAAARPPAPTTNTCAASQPQPQANGSHATISVAGGPVEGNRTLPPGGQDGLSAAVKGVAQVTSARVNGSSSANSLGESKSGEAKDEGSGAEGASLANDQAAIQLQPVESRNFEPEPGEPIQAYAKLELPGFSYYIQTLSVSIGRRPAHAAASANGNGQGSATQTLADSHIQAEADVDVDLGPLKSISRLHARIYYHTGLIPSWGLAPGVSYASLQSPRGASGFGLDTSYATFDASRALHAQSEGSGRFVLEVAGRNGAFVDDVFVGKGAIVPMGRRTKIQIAERVFYFVLPPPPKAISDSVDDGSARDVSSSLSENSSSEAEDDGTDQNSESAQAVNAAEESDSDSLGDSSALSDVDESSESGTTSARGGIASMLKRPRLIVKYRPRQADAKASPEPALGTSTSETASVPKFSGKRPSKTATKTANEDQPASPVIPGQQQQRAGSAPAKGKGKGKSVEPSLWHTENIALLPEANDTDAGDIMPVVIPPTTILSPTFPSPSPVPTTAPLRSEPTLSMSPTFAASPPPPIPANKRGRGRPRKDGMPNKSTKRKLDAAAAEEAAIAVITGLPPPAPPAPMPGHPDISVSPPPMTTSTSRQSSQPPAKKQRIETQLWTTGIGVAGRKRRRGDGVEDEPTLAVGTPIGIEALEAERRARVARQRRMAASQSIEKDSDPGSSQIKLEDANPRPPEQMTARERYAALLKSAPPPIQHSQRGLSTSSMSPPPTVRRVPIFIGSAPINAAPVKPSMDASDSVEVAKEAPPIVHHDGKLYLSPTVFGHMSPHEISRLENLGATEAVATLMSGLVSHLNERKRNQQLNPNAGSGAAARPSPSLFAAVGGSPALSPSEATLPSTSLPSVSPSLLPPAEQFAKDFRAGSSTADAPPEDTSKISSDKGPLAALGALASHPEAAGLVALLKQQQEAGAGSNAMLSLTPAQLQLLQMANQLADEKAAKKAEKKKKKKAEKAAAAAAAAAAALAGTPVNETAGIKDSAAAKTTNTTTSTPQPSTEGPSAQSPVLETTTASS